MTYNKLEIRAVTRATSYCPKAMEKIYPWGWKNAGANVYEESGIDLVLHLKNDIDSIVDPSQEVALFYPPYKDGYNWIHYIVHNDTLYHKLTDFNPHHVVPAAHPAGDNMRKYWREQAIKDLVPPNTNLTLLLHLEEDTPELRKRLSELLS